MSATTKPTETPAVTSAGTSGVEVPDFSGMSVTDARRGARKLGVHFAPKVAVPSHPGMRGHVIDQDPKPGQRIGEGEQLTVFIGGDPGLFDPDTGLAVESGQDLANPALNVSAATLPGAAPAEDDYLAEPNYDGGTGPVDIDEDDAGAPVARDPFTAFRPPRTAAVGEDTDYAGAAAVADYTKAGPVPTADTWVDDEDEDDWYTPWWARIPRPSLITVAALAAGAAVLAFWAFTILSGHNSARPVAGHPKTTAAAHHQSKTTTSPARQAERPAPDRRIIARASEIGHSVPARPHKHTRTRTVVVTKTVTVKTSTPPTGNDVPSRHEELHAVPDTEASTPEAQTEAPTPSPTAPVRTPAASARPAHVHSSPAAQGPAASAPVEKVPAVNTPTHTTATTSPVPTPTRTTPAPAATASTTTDLPPSPDGATQGSSPDGD